VRRGYEYNYKLQALQVGTHAGSLPVRHSFVTIEAQNVVLTALKKAEDGDALIFRFYEWAGKDAEVRIQVPEGAKSARLANLQEIPEGSPLSIEDGNTISVPSHPYEIVTVRVEYPSPTQ
jgi:alpha-mannosidase